MLIVIDDILKEKNKTRYWLAKEVKAAYPTIMKLCNNETKLVNFDLLQNICVALECDPNDIMKLN